MNDINETGQLQRLSPSEVAEIENRAIVQVWWDINYPVAYRYYRKFMRWIGAEL